MDSFFYPGKLKQCKVMHMQTIGTLCTSIQHHITVVYYTHLEASSGDYLCNIIFNEACHNFIFSKFIWNLYNIGGIWRYIMVLYIPMGAIYYGSVQLGD